MTEPRGTDGILDDDGQLGEEVGAEAGPGSGAGDDSADLSDDIDNPAEGGQLAYDCAAWAGETRGLLKSLLVTNGIAHAWQGTTLTVREADEGAVDELIDEVAGTARPALDPSAPKVVYEVSTWPASLQAELAGALAVADIAYEWDEFGDLVVLESAEEEVSLVLEDLPDPEESGISSDDGVAVHEVLDSVFMSADRLARNGGDAAGTVNLADAAAIVEQLALPFGFEPGQWRTFVGVVQELRDAVAGPGDGTVGASDEEISELAQRVRDLVRQYV